MNYGVNVSSESSHTTPAWNSAADAMKVYSPSSSNATVAVCLIVRNETLYIEEWMDFHISLGFSPIYVYDNSLAPDLELQTWLEFERYDLQQYITIIHFPQAPVQYAAYDRCIKQDAVNETFVAMIDIDEFVVLKKHDSIVDFMLEHCDVHCGQLSMNWNMMSVSNETGYRPGPITKRNVHSVGFWGTVKVIVRPTYVADNMNWVHSVALKRGHWVDTNGAIIRRPGGWKKQQHWPAPTDKVVLNHYRFLSEAEFYYKNCIRGDAIQQRGVVPKCTREVARYGMHGGSFDDLAWQQLRKRVPKYAALYDDMPYDTRPIIATNSS